MAPGQIRKNPMYRSLAIAILALSLGGSFALNVPTASAQTVEKKAAAKPRAVAPRAARTAAPRPAHTAAPRAARTATPRTVHTAKPRATRTVRSPATRTVKSRTTRTVRSPATRTVKSRTTRTVTPSATRTRAVTTARFRSMPSRGAGRASIRGHSYSVWRSGYRVRHDGGWRTFVALSALTAIAVGSSQYYPYAYVSAPQPYCSGLTADGCELHWQDVETIEGDVVSQCVAYCPWQ
jgi:hypothetical protein